jgi:nitroreductase
VTIVGVWENAPMDFKEIVLRNRSYRRFDQNALVSEQTLRELVDLARRVPSAANRQPLRYAISCAPEANGLIFATLGWAAYLKEWPGPKEGERPSAYIVILSENPDGSWVQADVGIAAQTILLGATARGLGGCMLGNICREELAAFLGLSPNLSVLLVIALGKPIEKVMLEELSTGGSIEYYRTSDGIHHVPKRSLQEVLLKSWS